MPPRIGSVGSTSGFLSMPWSLAFSAERMKLATLRPGIAVGYWKARNRPRRARLSGRQREDVAALPEDLAALDDVGRVAHQRIGEGRLARAVGAHDRVDLALADGQVDALQDLVLGLGAAGATRRPRMTSWSVGGWSVTRRSGLPGGWVSGVGSRCAGRTRSARVIEFEGAGDGVADADPQHVDRAAGDPVADRGVLRIVAWRRSSGRWALRGRGGPRSSRSRPGRGSSS